MKKLFLVGGGTGGHCIPMSVVYSQSPRKYDCYIITDKRGKKYFEDIDQQKVIVINKLIPSQSKLAIAINAPLILAKSIWCHITFKPEVVIGFGGFFTIPVLLISTIMRKKVFLHEGNAFIGKANKFLFKLVGSIFTTFSDTRGVKLIKNKNSFKVGLPTRSFKYRKSFRRKTKEEFIICIIGGSQGAKSLTDTVAKSIIKFSKKCNKNLMIYHQCRNEDVNLVKQIYKKNNIRNDVNQYFSNIGDIYNITDLIISRAGSSTINEIIKYGIPSILIPYPHAADNHQYFNALVLKNLSCAEIIMNNKINVNHLTGLIKKIFNDHKKRKLIKKILLKESITDTVKKIFNHIDNKI